MTSNPNYKAELVGVFGHPVAETPTCVMQDAPVDVMYHALARAFGLE